MWRNSDDHTKWIALSQKPDLQPADAAKVLASTACQDETAGYIVKAIAKRTTTLSPFYNDGLKKLIAKALADKATCLAAKYLSDETIVALQRAAAD